MTSRTGKKSCYVPYVEVGIGILSCDKDLLQGLYNAGFSMGVDSKLNIQLERVSNQVIFAKKIAL